jgi:hypothetical protein
MQLTRRTLLKSGLLILGSSTVTISPATSASGVQDSANDRPKSMMSLDVTHAYPGGVVELKWAKVSAELPLVKYGLEEPAITETQGFWRVLIGLSLDTLPGDYVLYIKEPESELPGTSVTFSVEQKRYPVTVSEGPLPQFKSLPDPLSVLDYLNSVPPKLPFRPPVDESWEGNFGRVFTGRQANGSSRSVTQDFCSFNTNEIKMVIAPQNGIICRIDQDSENSPARLVIDHGRGVYSVLDGVYDLSIELGNGIVGGAALGRLKPQNDLAGREETDLVDTLTRRPTVTPSPGTLNWYCLLNSAVVDPMILTR